MNTSTHIVWHETSITRIERERLNKHKSCVLWFTGLSGSGKSTLANRVDRKLHELGVRSFVLDGDNIRHGLCHDLGFSLQDRAENMRRIGEVAKLFVDSGIITLTAFISPLRSEREKLKELIGEQDWLEIFVDCPLSTCEERDPKGLYKKARKGEIRDFTGISSPYEPPENPDLTIRTDEMSISEATDQLITLLQSREIL